MKIKVNKIEPFKAQAYDSKGRLLGLLNEYEMNDLRIQIAQNRAEGYFMVYKGEKIPIDKEGKIKSWPIGFYDLIEDQLAELFKCRFEGPKSK